MFKVKFTVKKTSRKKNTYMRFLSKFEQLQITIPIFILHMCSVAAMTLMKKNVLCGEASLSAIFSKFSVNTQRVQ